MMLEVLDHFGLSYPTHAELRALFKTKIPLPLIRTNDTVEVWLDRDYIAYSYRDELNAHYAYITRRHLVEERAVKNNPIISNAFKWAREIMHETHNRYAIMDILPPKDESKREYMRVDES